MDVISKKTAIYLFDIIKMLERSFSKSGLDLESFYKLHKEEIISRVLEAWMIRRADKGDFV